MVLKCIWKKDVSHIWQFQKCQQNPKTKGMPLSSYLLKPMQRITRYPLMIEKVPQLHDQTKTWCCTTKSTFGLSTATNMFLAFWNWKGNILLNRFWATLRLTTQIIRIWWTRWTKRTRLAVRSTKACGRRKILTNLNGCRHMFSVKACQR